MKKITLLLLSFFTAWAISAQLTVLNEPFDDASQLTVTAGAFFTDGSGDFFILTDGTTIGSFYDVSGFSGQFLAAQDTDGEGGPTILTLEWQNLDITDLTNLTFSGLFAEDDDGSNQDWDSDSSVLFEYSIDGGSFQNLLAFEAIGGTNTEPAEDTDFDGVGDGTFLTAIAQSFTKTIAGTGSSLTLRLTISGLDAGDEDIAIDLIQVTGDSVSPTSILISEFQPNPSGSDPANVTVELSGPSGESFTGWLLSIESDSGSGAGLVDRATEVSGTFDSNGLLLVSIPDFENPSFTVALTDAFTGTTSTDIDVDNDGVADDLTTFGTVYDAIGIPDTTGEPLYGTDLGGLDFAYTGDEPRLVFRDASIGDWYAINDPDNGQVFDITGTDVTPTIFNTDPTVGTDTFGSINPSAQAEPIPILISEFQPNPSGSDPANVTVELSGPSGESFTGWLLSIESDSGSSAGLVDRATEVSGTFDSNGLLLVSIPDFENPSFTVALTDAFTGTTSTDIDVDNDGVADDLTTFGTVYDAIGIPDTTGEPLYGTDLGGLDFAYTGDEPRLVFRDASIGDWYAINDPDNGQVFDITGTDVTPTIFNTDPTVGTDTFGAINPEVGGAVPNVIGIVAVDAVKAEGDSGTTNFTFSVTRTGDTSQATSVQYATTGDVDASDFPGNLPSGTINFAADDAEETLTVLVNGDGDQENDETFTITLSNPTNSELLDPVSAEGIIQDDDAPVAAFTLIHDIQGSGTSVAITTEVTVEAIVVGDFSANNQLDGFFIQEEDTDADADPSTSEGIFVYCGSDNCGSFPSITVGDKVQITGTPTEFNDKSQLPITAMTLVDSGNTLPTAANVTFPVANVSDLEAFEGMLVNISSTAATPLTVTEFFNLDRFGETVLFAGGDLNGRPFQFTQRNAPDPTGYANALNVIAKGSILIDDGRTGQNEIPIINARGGNDLSPSNTLRGGDTVDTVVGVMDFAFGDYRIQPTQPINYQPTNARPTTPEDVGGSLKVVSLNVLNYFTTLDDGTLMDNGQEPRGANNSTEFDRQTQKLVKALTDMNADIFGLVEIENDFSTDGNYPAIANLVDELNLVLGSGTYDWVRPSTGATIGDDAIAVGFIYKPGSVTLLGSSAILNTAAFLDPNSSGNNRNRAALAQTFQEISTGGVFTATINHFKSKGRSNGTLPSADEDANDGEGFWGDTRAKAAQALVDWLGTDPTGSGDVDFMILGDLNGYAEEPVITTLESNGFTDLAQANLTNPYSFVFDGQWGTLDYALVNGTLNGQVTGVTEWHINADEPDALDYDTTFNDPSLFDGTNPFRNSDHDPVIVGLSLTPSVVIADYDLQITEMWPGNEPGSNLTSDWFEIVNNGTEAWVSGVDPDLYYDDESQDPSVADLINGITDIQPGERVIVVIDGASGADQFKTIWEPAYDLSGIEIGYADGSGLGQGGDGVTLFVGGPTVESIADFETYPDAESNGGQSYDVELAAFSTVGNASDAGATFATNDEGQPAIASPGNQGPLEAVADLQITEMWPGNDPGENLSEDWFEIINNGTAPWVSGTDPDLYYDDSPSTAANADPITGLTDIQPGERVIVLVSDLGAAAITEFNNLWSTDYDLTDIEIGIVDGSGLGQGGDGVTLWVGNPSGTSDFFLSDFELYPDASANGGQSYDVELAAFSTEANASNAAATSSVNDEGQPAIASPGNQGPLAPSLVLQVTEIWPGQGGTDLTADWFEIYNSGSAAWVSGTNADLFYDDESADPADALAILGLTDIQPGESVIVMIGDATDATTFNTVWSPDYDLTGIEIGHVDGSGLGGGGDVVTLWLGDPSDSGLLLDSASYPDTASDDGESYDIVNGAFSVAGGGSAAPGTNIAAATTALSGDSADTPAVGSPGNQGPLAAGDIPDIRVNTSALTSFLALSEQGPSSVSGVINDPTDPAATIGIVFAGSGDSDDAIGDLTITTSSSNQTVVPDGNLSYVGNADGGTLTITPAAVGFSTITVTIENLEGESDSYTINYAASASGEITSRFHTGASDGSTAIATGDFMWVGDDEDQTLRLYDCSNSGLPVSELNFNTDLGSSVEIDIEGSFQSGNTLFWIGSHATTNRSVVFSTTISGTGATSSLSYGDKYTSLRDDLLNAGFGLPTNIEIEALALAPGSSSTVYLGFRVPDDSGEAIVIPVTNFTSLPGSGNGSATFGSPFNLDLGGRTLRSMECNANGCVLIGGPNGTVTDFALYTWTGNPVEAPELRSANLMALQTGGSFEGIVGLPTSSFLGTDGDALTIKLMSDLGAFAIYEDGVENKDQRREWKKFRTDIVTLGSVVVPPAFTDPLINEFVADHTGTDTSAFIEILGDSNTDYSSFTLLEIEGDGTSPTGNIDAVIPLGTTDANGYWLDDEDAENGTITILLVEGFTGSVNDDIDADDDGLIDNAPWSRIVDGIATVEDPSEDLAYAVALEPNFDGITFQPGGASRIPNGTDSDSTSDWVRNDFDLAGIEIGTPEVGEALNTPGAENQLVLPPLPDLQITEIWPGNEPGSNLTADWFEITNTSDIPWTPDLGGLYFDDESQAPADAVLISGIGSIAPGEVVIAIDDTSITEFLSVWESSYNLTGIQIGTYSGAGLSQGGDGVTLWIGDPTSGGILADFESYPDANANGGQSYDVELAAFSNVGNTNNAGESAIANDEGQFAVGSPGNKGPLIDTVPTAVCQDITIQLDATNNASITAADIDNGSSDDVGIASLSVSPSSFTDADLGDNTVTLTVTDTSGNTATCTATVTVEPSFCPDFLPNEDPGIVINSGGGIFLGLDAAFGTSDTTNGSPCALALQNNDGGQPFANFRIPLPLATYGISAGDELFISLDALNNGGVARIEVLQNNQPNTALAANTYTGAGWNTYSTTITVPAGITSIDIWLYSNYLSSSPGTAYYDNLWIQNLTAGGGNVDPIANAGADQTVTDGDNSGDETVTLDGSGSFDPDGTITNYSWSDGTGEIATGETPTVTLPVGTNNLTLTVTDNDGATDTDTVTITVNPGAGNLDPVADAGADQSVADGDGGGTEPVTLDGSGSFDPDGNIVSYVWSIGATNIATGQNPTVVLPVGTTTVTLMVMDNDGATDTDTVDITVVDPTASCPDSLPNEDPSIVLPVGAGFLGLDAAVGTSTTTNGSPCALAIVNNDAGQPFANYRIPIVLANYGINPGDELLISLDALNNGGIARLEVNQDNQPNTALAFNTYSGPGWETFSQTITVPSGISSIDIWIYSNYLSSSPGTTYYDNLIVTNVTGGGGNLDPTAIAGPDQNVVDGDGNGSEDVTLDGSGSFDLDGTIVDYSWSNGSTGVSPTATFPVGTTTVTLTVTDNDGATDTDTVDITVTGPVNLDPIANAGPDQTVIDGDSSGTEDVTLDGSGSFDLDGTIVAYSWSNGATGPNPTATFPVGTTTVTLTVTDDGGATASDTVDITVVDPGAPCPDSLPNEEPSIPLTAEGGFLGIDDISGTSTVTNGSPCALALTNNDVGQPFANYRIPIVLADHGINPGDQLLISLDGNSSQGTARIEVNRNNSPNTALAFNTYVGGWSTFSQVVTVPSGTTSLNIWLYSNYLDSGSGGTAFYDNLLVRNLGPAAVPARFNLNGLNVWPNPATESVSMGFDEPTEVVEFQVFDLLGRLVRTVKVDKNEGEHQMQVYDLPVGTYFIKTTDSRGQQFQEQMVIER